MIGFGARLRACSRWLLIKRSRDVTSSIGERSAVVVAPHPDDETLGCGGRILLSRSVSTPVTVVVVGDGSGAHIDAGSDRESLCARRRGELSRATAQLGVEPPRVIPLGYPDDALSDCIADIAADVERLVRQITPDDVYVTCVDEYHPDHAATARAVGLALQRLDRRPRLLQYPIWLWADWPISRRFRNLRTLRRWLSVVVHRSTEIVRLNHVRDAKREALSAYKSQLGELSLSHDIGDYAPSGDKAALPRSVVLRAIDGPELFFLTEPERILNPTTASSRPRAATPGHVAMLHRETMASTQTTVVGRHQRIRWS